MAHLTKKIVSLTQIEEVRKFIETFHVLSLSCKKGSISITPTDNLVTIRYSFNEHASCGCTIRRESPNNPALNVKFFWKREAGIKIDAKYDVSLSKAESLLKNTISIHETSPDKTYDAIKNLVMNPQTQTTAAESISDIKKKLDRLL